MATKFEHLYLKDTEALISGSNVEIVSIADDLQKQARKKRRFFFWRPKPEEESFQEQMAKRISERIVEVSNATLNSVSTSIKKDGRRANWVQKLSELLSKKETKKREGYRKKHQLNSIKMKITKDSMIDDHTYTYSNTSSTSSGSFFGSPTAASPSHSYEASPKKNFNYHKQRKSKDSSSRDKNADNETLSTDTVSFANPLSNDNTMANPKKDWKEFLLQFFLIKDFSIVGEILLFFAVIKNMLARPSIKD